MAFENGLRFPLHSFIESTIPLIEGTHLVFLPFGLPPENLRELSFVLVCLCFQRSQDISDIALVAWPSGARPDLSSEDEEMKQKLVKCTPRAYSELID